MNVLILRRFETRISSRQERQVRDHFSCADFASRREILRALVAAEPRRAIVDGMLQINYQHSETLQ